MDKPEKDTKKLSRNLYCWGFGKNGQIGKENINNSIVPNKIVIKELEENNDEIFTINGGEFHNAILTTNNNLYMFGKNVNGQLGLGNDINTITPTLLQISNNKKIIKVACGGEHTLAVTEENALFTWGLNFFGQLGLTGISQGSICKYNPTLVKLNLNEDENIKI